MLNQFNSFLKKQLKYKILKFHFNENNQKVLKRKFIFQFDNEIL